MQDNALAKRFGARVREIRRARGISQFKMAAEHGFSVCHYSKIENGLVEVRLPMVGKIARTFGLELSELLDGV